MSNGFICSAFNLGQALSVFTGELHGGAESASLPVSKFKNGEKEFRYGAIGAMDVQATVPGCHSYVTPSMILAFQSREFRS